MRRLALLLLAAAALQAAPRIASCTVRLDASPGGTGAALATVRLAEAAPGPCLVPVGFTALTGLRLESAPAGTRIEEGPRDGQCSVRLVLPEGVPAEAAVSFRFEVPQAFVLQKQGPGERQTLPAGSRLFRHAFVNTQPVRIDAYRFEFRLPEGFRVQAVREQLPRLARTEVGPRVLLDGLDGGRGAVLQCRDLHQGDDTSMLIEVVPQGRSLGWLAVGLVLSILYLVRFRDLVAPARP